MTVKLQAHWAARLQQIERETQDLRANPAVVQYIRAQQEWRALTKGLAADAGVKPEDIVACEFKTTADGPVLELSTKEPK
jgi:hypothetical protein